MTTPDEIVTYARTWIGTRWRHQGRTERGIDCVGLLVRTMQNFHIPHEDVTGYRRDPSPEFIKHLHACTTHGSDPVHGAVGVFNDSIMPCHTGIFAVENGIVTVIHSEAFPSGICHEEFFEGPGSCLARNLVSVRLIKEVDYVLVPR